MKEDLQRLIRFTELIHQFQAVELSVYSQVGSNRRENDAEHTYQVTMAAWYLNSVYNLGFDSEKLLKYALSHDLVEAYAGDTSLVRNTEAHATKHEREQKALQEIELRFPESNDIYNTIKAYERREDKESKFIYALDKMLPMINAYLDNGRSWHENNISYTEMQEYKLPKVALDPTIEKLYKELTSLLEEKKDTLFPRP